MSDDDRRVIPFIDAKFVWNLSLRTSCLPVILPRYEDVFAGPSYECKCWFGHLSKDKDKCKTCKDGYAVYNRERKAYEFHPSNVFTLKELCVLVIKSAPLKIK